MKNEIHVCTPTTGIMLHTMNGAGWWQPFSLKKKKRVFEEKKN
jgi:hypothetical protein